MIGRKVPAIATVKAFRPTSLILSKWMCIPDSMIISVTPMLPMNDQMFGTLAPAQ